MCYIVFMLNEFDDIFFDETLYGIINAYGEITLSTSSC